MSVFFVTGGNGGSSYDYLDSTEIFSENTWRTVVAKLPTQIKALRLATATIMSSLCIHTLAKHHSDFSSKCIWEVSLSMSVSISWCRIRVIGCVLSPTHLHNNGYLIWQSEENISNDTSNTLNKKMENIHVLQKHPSPSVLANLGNNGVHCPPDC